MDLSGGTGVAFIHVNLLDNRSEFLAPLEIRMTREQESYVIVVSGAITIADTIAHISELIAPLSIFLGLTRQNLVTQSLCYVFRGSWSTRSYSNTGSGHAKTMCAL